jgi:hypothetical protein
MRNYFTDRHQAGKQVTPSKIAYGIFFVLAALACVAGCWLLSQMSECAGPSCDVVILAALSVFGLSLGLFTIGIIIYLASNQKTQWIIPLVALVMVIVACVFWTVFGAGAI